MLAHRNTTLLLFLSWFPLTAGCGDDDAVQPPTGSISVLTDADADVAGWHLTGPAEFDLSSQGDTTLTAMRAGDYTITWSVLTGAEDQWTEPDPVSLAQTLAPAGTLTFIGEFRPRLGDVVIRATPTGLNAPWHLLGPRGFDRGGTGNANLFDVAAGDYTFTWGEIVRWERPAPAQSSMTVQADRVTFIDGTYVEIVDSREPNDSIADASFLGGPLPDPQTGGAMVLETPGVFLDVDDDRDFFSFTAVADAPIAVRVDPLAGFGVTASARNLALRLWRRATPSSNWIVLAQINFNGAGNSEYLTPIEYAESDLFAVEIYSSDALATIQPYRLRIANGPITQ